MDPLDISCPDCGQPAGRPCLTVTGRRCATHRKRCRKSAPKEGPATVPDPLSERCPLWSCRARPGYPCVTTDGRTTHAHSPRWRAAIMRAADMPADGPQPAAAAMNPPATTDGNQPRPHDALAAR